MRDFLSSLDPDNDRLLASISRHISDEMLAEIAAADYGQQQQRHLVPLLHLRDTGEFIVPMHFYPCEVLELTRNSEPDWTVDMRGHWERAFACASLLRARQQPWNYSAATAQPSFDLIQLIHSMRLLSLDMASDTMRMVSAWMLDHDLDGTDAQVIYFGVGLLWLLLQSSAPRPDRELIDLAQWIVRREAEIHKAMPRAQERWLLGIGRDPAPSPWETLGREFSKISFGAQNQELREWVHFIGRELARG